MAAAVGAEVGSGIGQLVTAAGAGLGAFRRAGGAADRAEVAGVAAVAVFAGPAILFAVLGLHDLELENGVLVIADTKLPNFAVLGLDDLADSLPYVDYITPNETEAKYYTGEEDPEKMADVFLSKGVRNVIIKLGSKGCFFKNSKESIYMPAFSIDTVDATGAGDNFLAGFASEIIRGSSIKDALTFGCACGAICSTAVGSGTSLKDRQQVIDFIEKKGKE